MKEKDPVSSDRFDNQKQGFCQDKNLHVGQTKLQVRLAPDMDEKFLERLGRTLTLENSPPLNLKI